MLKARKGAFYVLEEEDGERFAYVYNEGIDGVSILRKNLKISLTDDKDLVTTVVKTLSVINIKQNPQDKIESRTAILCVPVMGIDQILGIFF